MRTILKLSILVVMTLAIYACGPVYKTVNFYEPPADETGKACVIGCEDRRAACAGDCNARYDGCIYEAQAQGRDDYLNAKDRYLDEKERCLMRSYKGSKECDNLVEPHLDSYVRDSHCSRECGCDDDFDRCFQVCGGNIRQETHCVSMCDY